jgi:hypothetical protein
MRLVIRGPCTLGWYLPLHCASEENRASQPSGPAELGQKGAGTSIRGGNKGTPRDGTTGVAPTLAWHELDAKFRRDLPDEAYTVSVVSRTVAWSCGLAQKCAC